MTYGFCGDCITYNLCDHIREMITFEDENEINTKNNAVWITPTRIGDKSHFRTTSIK